MLSSILLDAQNLGNLGLGGGVAALGYTQADEKVLIKWQCC